VVLVDVSDPRHPQLVSGGNVEPSWDSVAVADRLLLASKDRVTELSVPFLFVTSYAPARESLVPPEGVELVVRFNRPLAAPSFTDESVRLLGPDDSAVEVELEVSGSTLKVRPEEALAASTAYRLVVDSRVTDQRGGALLIPFRLGFQTGAVGSRLPELVSVAPSAASRAGGTVLTVTGRGLGGVASVRVGGQVATFERVSETQLRVTAPAVAEAGPADLEVTDQGGPEAVLPSSVLYLDPLAGAPVALFPDHGPVEGGTRVRLAVGGRQALAPGTRVRIGGRDAVDVDIEDLSSLSFTTPAVDDATLAPVELVRPGEAPVQVGLFSYDLPVGTTLNLPGFPPKVASELKLVGDTLYVGVSNGGHEGLEIFDVKIEERPIRLGGMRTDRPVRGLDVSGVVAYLATDDLGLSVVDVSDPERPFLADRAVTFGRATGVRLEGAYAYVSVTDPSPSAGVIQRFSAQGPRLTPPESVALDADALALDLGTDRFYALTSQVSGGSGTGLALSIYDRTGLRVGRVSVLTETKSYEELVACRLVVRGGRAYVSVGTKLYVFDLSNEASPQVLQSTDLGSPVTGLTFAGGALLAATSGDATVIEIPPTDLLSVDVQPPAGGLAPPETLIQARFTLPVSPESVTPETFQVHANDGTGWREVPGAREVVFAVRGSTLVFTPVSPFLPGDEVRVVLTQGLRAFDTRPLAAPVHSTFHVTQEGALQPIIGSLEPASGLVNATTTLLLRGAGFRAETSVLVGGQAAGVEWLAADTLRVTVPPSVGSASGPALVEVIDTPSGLRAMRLGGFLYREPLRLLALSSTQSPQQGGKDITVTGRGFIPGLTVTFGDTASFDVRVLSMEQAVVRVPPHASGLVDVIVALPGQSFTLPRAFLYGSGAVSRLPTLPVAQVIVDNGVAYAALGGETAIVGQDGTVYAESRATAQGGLLIARLSELPTISEVRSLTFNAVGGARRLAKAGSRIYLAAGTAGLRVVEVSQVDAPTVTATLNGTGATVDVVVKDAVLFVADGAGVSVYRLGETAAPLPVGRKALPGGASAMALHGGYLLVADGNDNAPQLHVLDARKGDLPEVGSFPLSAVARHLTASGTRAYASLGRARQVAVVELVDPANPAPAGQLVLTDPRGSTWMSAEQTWVGSGVAYVAAGGGKVQRFAVPVGQPPYALERAQVVGDARTLAFADNYLLVGTLLLDVNGRTVELPLDQASDQGGTLAGSLAAVAMDHLELVGTTPANGDTVAPGSPMRVHVTELPDLNTASAVTLSPVEGGGAQVPVARRVQSTTEGADVVLEPYAPLATGTAYRLRIGQDLANLEGGKLGVDVDVRFRTATTASAERPVIARVQPAFGLEAGGDTVTVLGEHFVAGCSVSFGGSPALVTSVAGDGRSVTVRVPPGTAGPAAVEVVNVGGLSAVRLGAYRYLVPPAISSVTPGAAAYNSGDFVTLSGQGLFGGSQVTFGGVPSPSVELLSSETLRVRVPTNITGPVDLRVLTPAPGGPVSAVRPNGFTFTLQPLVTYGQGAEALAPVGSALLMADNGRLVALDLSIPESPASLGDVAGVPQATALTVSGDEAFLAGTGVVVRYELGQCGSAPRMPCELRERERIYLSPGDVVPTSVVATPGAAYVALGGGNELALLGRVDGGFRVVARTYLAGGNIRGMQRIRGALAVLVDAGSTTRLEVRSFDDAQLALLGQVEGLPDGAMAMAAEGNRLLLGLWNQARLVDVTELAAPVVVGSWTSDAPGNVLRTVALSGPWAWLGGTARMSWVDLTDGMVERTWAPVLEAYDQQAVVAAGVAAVASSTHVRIFHLPYPVTVGSSPRPGGALPPDGTVSVAVSPLLPLQLATSSTLGLRQGGAEVTGTPSRTGFTLGFTPDPALQAGVVYTAEAHLAPTSVLGGGLRGPWRFPVVGGVADTQMRVDALSPDHGGPEGALLVDITGANLQAVSSVLFGGRPAPLQQAPTATLLRVLAPASPVAGPVTVELRTDGGERLQVPGGFVYVAPLQVTGVAPTRLGLEGGWVTLTGTGFTLGTTVRVDGAAVPTSASSSTSLSFRVPAGAAGYVTVALAQAGTAPVVLSGAVRRADAQPPSVVSWQPLEVAQSGQNVPLGTQIGVRFDEAIDPETFTQARLVRVATGVTEPSTLTVDADNQGLTLAPVSRLSPTTHYRVSVVGVADVGGNVLTHPSVGQRTFRTVDTVPPTVSLVVRGTGRVVETGDLFTAQVSHTFEVRGEDDSRGLRFLRLTVDGVPVSGSGVFTYQWPAASVGTTSRLVATAEDHAGNTADYAVTVQVVNDVPPAVSFTQPAVTQLTLEEGATLDVAVSATDNTRLSSMELRLDGASEKHVTGLTTASGTLTHRLRMAPVSGAPVERVLTALAMDEGNLLGNAAPVTLTVVPDTTGPQLVFTAPAENVRVAGGSSVMLAVEARDNSPVQSVVFSVDGVDLEPLTMSPWVTRWDAPVAAEARTVSVSVRATDARGNTGTATRTFTVEPASG
ncbi:MAG TPA: IPT/TIG domain-containing protein, partial [Myxococcus sp.]|nr:IPT/TIG domain-containing protein [Myxococcus sp.]